MLRVSFECANNLENAAAEEEARRDALECQMPSPGGVSNVDTYSNSSHIDEEITQLVDEMLTRVEESEKTRLTTTRHLPADRKVEPPNKRQVSAAAKCKSFC